MLDLTTRQLLQDAAVACFSTSGGGAGPAELGWIGLLTPAELGGEGFLPAEAALIALETGRQNAPSTWALSAAAAATAAVGGAPTGLVGALLSSELASSFCVAGEERWNGSSLVEGAVLTVICDRRPEVVVVVDRQAARAQVVSVAVERCTALDDDVLETVRQVFQVEIGDEAALVLDPSPAGAILASCRVLMAADTVGAVGSSLGLVTRHLVEREAFGVPVASFQALQHRLVDLTIFEQAAEALVHRAARGLAAGDAGAARLVAALHSYVEARAVAAVDDLIQLAGAMGFTWEYPLHHHLRRVATNASLLGSGRSSRDALLRAASEGER